MGQQNYTGLVTYLINLDRAPERLAKMDERLERAGLSYVRIPAVDGRTLNMPPPGFSAVGYALLHGRRPYGPEIGCYFSHQQAAREFLKTSAEFALILEDDLLFPDDFAQILEAAMEDSCDWDVLRLSTVNSGKKFVFKPLTKARGLAIALTREKGAGAYLVNRRAAEWIVKDLAPMRLAYDIAFDLEYLSLMKAAFVFPVPVDQSAEVISQIQGQARLAKLPRWRYLSVLPYRAYLELMRVVLRGTLFVFLKLKYLGR